MVHIKFIIIKYGPYGYHILLLLFIHINHISLYNLQGPKLNGLLGSSGLHRQEPMERHKVLLKLAFSGDLTQKGKALYQL